MKNSVFFCVFLSLILGVFCENRIKKGNITDGDNEEDDEFNWDHGKNRTKREMRDLFKPNPFLVLNIPPWSDLESIERAFNKKISEIPEHLSSQEKSQKIKVITEAYEKIKEKLKSIFL